MEILSVDAGPGMTDVPRCLRDGYSTAGTPGNGLGAVRRLSSVFDVHSTAGAGTVVVSRLCRPAAGPASGIAAARYEYAAISIPAPHEEVCGDTWRIAERDGDCAVLVVDGLGHGPLAADAATRAGAVFDESPFDDAEALIERAHRALSGTRGAALAVARMAAPACATPASATSRACWLAASGPAAWPARTAPSACRSGRCCRSTTSGRRGGCW